MKEFLKEMFSSGTSVSSKRVSGFIGWIICIAVAIYCTINVIQAPLIIDTIVIASTAMLGLETVASMFKKKKDEEK